MKKLEFQDMNTNPRIITTPMVSKSPRLEQLCSMTTDHLVRMLQSSEHARLENTPLGQQIIKILQEREGNAFLRR